MNDQSGEVDSFYKKATTQAQPKSAYSTNYSKAEILQANQTNPKTFLESHGYSVASEKEANHWVASNGVNEIRLTLQPDGKWLHFDKSSQKGGDNISLVMSIDKEATFVKAVGTLISNKNVSRNTEQPAASLTQAQPKSAYSTNYSKAEILQANQTNPKTFLESHGYSVASEKEANHWVASNGVNEIRLTLQPDGKWLHFDKSSRKGGDNISLVMSIDKGATFVKAVGTLISNKNVNRNTEQPAASLTQAQTRSSYRDRNTKHFTNLDLENAKQTDPTAFLESHGYTVKREGQGRHWIASDGTDEIRLTLQSDGKWVYCDKMGSEGGDNISLVMRVSPSTNFVKAVHTLIGEQTIGNASYQTKPINSISGSSVVPEKRLPPILQKLSLSEQAIAENAGRKYLMDRGISSASIFTAEKCGMLRYQKSYVVFCGYDEQHKLQSATKRSTDPNSLDPKRDIKGTLKMYTPILPSDTGKVDKIWIVEGGADALALHDIARRQGAPLPTVIVTGGANARSFLERPYIQEMLKSASKITIAGENEKDSATQAKTNAQREKLATRIEEITGKKPNIWTPNPAKGKDIADFNARQLERLRSSVSQMRVPSAEKTISSPER